MGIKIIQNQKSLVIGSIGLLILLGRLLPHPANFTPLAAISLFGSSFLPKKWIIPVILGSLFISDIFLGFYGFEMFFVYGSFALIALFGQKLKNNPSFFRLGAVSITSSLLFFIITNFGVWLDPHFFYPKTIEGLIACYVAAIPFFKNTLAGDLTYTFTFFYLYRVLYYSYARPLISYYRSHS